MPAEANRQRDPSGTPSADERRPRAVLFSAGLILGFAGGWVAALGMLGSHGDAAGLVIAALALGAAGVAAGLVDGGATVGGAWLGAAIPWIIVGVIDRDAACASPSGLYVICPPWNYVAFGVVTLAAGLVPEVAGYWIGRGCRWVLRAAGRG